MSTGLRNFDLRVLKRAPKDTRTKKLSNLSSPPESNGPNLQEPTQQHRAHANAVVADESSRKQWNLRPRKPVSAQQPPNQTNVVADESSVKQWNLRPRKLVSAQQPLDQTNEAVNLDGGVHRNEPREKKKEKLWISLSKEEIEEDLYSMTGSMPSRKPKKRTRAVQQLVDKVFPGLSLDGTSADTYRVQRFP